MQNHHRVSRPVDRQHGERGLKEKVEMEEGEEEEELLTASTAVDLVTLPGNAQTVADDVMMEEIDNREMIPVVHSNCIKLRVNPFSHMNQSN